MTGNGTYVLVVDDEPYLCKVLTRILEMEGYEVATATNGNAALEMVHLRKPAVLLADLVMPGMGGRELSRMVRQLSPATHIVYFTGKADPPDPLQREELHSEADAFVAKPATSNEILLAVEGVLQRARL